MDKVAEALKKQGWEECVGKAIREGMPAYHFGTMTMFEQGEVPAYLSGNKFLSIDPIKHVQYPTGTVAKIWLTGNESSVYMKRYDGSWDNGLHVVENEDDPVVKRFVPLMNPDGTVYRDTVKVDMIEAALHVWDERDDYTSDYEAMWYALKESLNARAEDE